MANLTKLRLYRFMSHADTVIDIEDGMTAIRGETDSGKSAITRALILLLYNKPTSIESYISYGATECFVTGTFDNGYIITRGRKNGENYYILYDPNGVKTEFKGFGFEVPIEITEAHGMKLMEIPGDSKNSKLSLNITQQLDPLFLFSSSNIVRAKTLGIITGAFLADGGADILNANKRELKSSLKKDKEILKSKKQLLDKYKDLDKDLEMYSLLQSIAQDIRDNVSVVNRIEVPYNMYLEHMRDIASVSALINFEAGLISVESMLEDLTEIHSKCHILSITVRDYIETCKNIQSNNLLVANEHIIAQYEAIIDELKETYKECYNIKKLLHNISVLTDSIQECTTYSKTEAALDRLDITTNDLVESCTMLNMVRKSYTVYNERILSIQKAMQYIQDLEKDIKENEVKYNEMLCTYDVCPVCKNVIKENV